MADSSLRVAHEQVGAAVVVHVAGEVDIVTAPMLREQLERVPAAFHQPEIVIIDLTEVTFLGSTGLSVLLEAHRRCHIEHMSLRVVAAEPVTRRPLQITGLDRVLDVVDSMERGLRSA